MKRTRDGRLRDLPTLLFFVYRSIKSLFYGPAILKSIRQGVKSNTCYSSPFGHAFGNAVDCNQSSVWSGRISYAIYLFRICIKRKSYFQSLLNLPSRYIEILNPFLNGFGFTVESGYMGSMTLGVSMRCEDEAGRSSESYL